MHIRRQGTVLSSLLVETSIDLTLTCASVLEAGSLVNVYTSILVYMLEVKTSWALLRPQAMGQSC